MIAPLLAMQYNSISTINSAQAAMMNNASAISFGASQPLRPSFGLNADVFELQNSANGTKISVAQRLHDAIQKALAKNIERTTPNYGGVDYKA